MTCVLCGVPVVLVRDEWWHQYRNGTDYVMNMNRDHAATVRGDR